MGDQGYRLVFDLAAQPSPWSSFWLLLAVGIVGLLLFCVVAGWIVGGFTGRWPRAGNAGWFVAVFTACVGGAMTFGGLQQMSRERAFREAVRTGPIQKAEGCLDYFLPGSTGEGRWTGVDERWSVAGRRLSYSQGDMGSAFHQIEARGGPVHADSRVRVSLVPDTHSGGANIVRLEVQDGACPAAPRPAD
jgi:hypothetical protein